MIIDSHCHAWSRWPYQPPVPDFESRGTVEQLLFEMQVNGVDQALIVCAEIDHNPENNAYIAEAVKRHPGRLNQVADVDSMWKPTYHQPGAASRLEQAVQSGSLVGFTHYLQAEDDGSWLTSPEGLAFFQVAVDRHLLASIHCHPHQQAAIRKLARQFPRLCILIHHMGHPHAGNQAELDEILASAACENIFIKTSGFYYAVNDAKWDYPYVDVQPIVRAIYQRYGARRMCWGSDYPVSRQFITYRQTIEAFRQHCTFIPASDQDWVMGDTLAELLE